MALSLQQIRELLTQQVRARWGMDPAWWVLDVWPDYCIVEAPDDRLYRVDYTLSEPDNAAPSLTLGEQLTPVQRVVEYLPLTESRVTLREAQDAEGWLWEVVLVEPGLSANGYYYDAEVLKRDAALFEGVRALARSDEEHLRNQSVSAVNVVGWYDGAHWVEGVGIVATFHVTEDAEWLAKKLRSAWEAGKRDLVGFSLVASGRGRRVLYERQLVTRVDAFTKVEFVDVVVNPAAGGRVLSLVAGLARAQTRETEERNMLEHLLTLLEAKRPELYTTLDLEHVTEAQVLALLDKAVQPSAAGGGGDPAKPAAPAAAPAGTATALHEAEQAAGRIALLEGRLTLREALLDTGLPAPVVEKVRTQFTTRLDAGQPFVPAELTEALQAERLMVSKLTESGKVRGFGSEVNGDPSRITEDAEEKAVQALVDFFDGKVLSFHEAIRHVPGSEALLREGNLRRRIGWRNWPRLAEAKGIRLRESLDSTSFDQVLADVMYKRMVAEYRLPDLNIWRQITTVGAVTDFRTQHRTRWGGYGNLPAVAQGAPYTALTSPTDEEATFAPSKRGGTEDLTWEMLLNDDASVIRFIPVRLGRAAAQTVHEFVFDFIADNDDIYDSVALFHNDHGNLTSTAFGSDTTQFMVHRLAMRQQTDMSNSKRLGLVPRFLLVPGDLEETAYDVFRRTTNLDAKFAQTIAPTILTIDYWADADNWFTVCDPMACPTIEVAFLNGQEEPDIFVQDDERSGTMFTSDKRTYKIRHVYGGAVLDYRGMQGAIVTG